MPKKNTKENKHHTITVWKNYTSSRSFNRKIMIVKPTKQKITEPTEEIQELVDYNFIVIQGAVSELTDGPGIEHSIIRSKVKQSVIKLSNVALFDLYRTLEIHFREGIKNNIIKIDTNEK